MSGVMMSFRGSMWLFFKRNAFTGVAGLFLLSLLALGAHWTRAFVPLSALYILGLLMVSFRNTSQIELNDNSRRIFKGGRILEYDEISSVTVINSPAYANVVLRGRGVHNLIVLYGYSDDSGLVDVLRERFPGKFVQRNRRGWIVQMAALAIIFILVAVHMYLYSVYPQPGVILSRWSDFGVTPAISNATNHEWNGVTFTLPANFRPMNLTKNEIFFDDKLNKYSVFVTSEPYEREFGFSRDSMKRITSGASDAQAFMKFIYSTGYGLYPLAFKAKLPALIMPETAYDFENSRWRGIIFLGFGWQRGSEGAEVVLVNKATGQEIALVVFGSERVDEAMIDLFIKSIKVE